MMIAFFVAVVSNFLAKRRLRAALSDPRYTFRTIDMLATIAKRDSNGTIRLLVAIGARCAFDNRRLWALESIVGPAVRPSTPAHNPARGAALDSASVGARLVALLTDRRYKFRTLGACVDCAGFTGEDRYEMTIQALEAIGARTERDNSNLYGLIARVGPAACSV